MRGFTELQLNVPHPVELDRGTVALDGEREVEFGPHDAVTITLAQDGPRLIDVPAVLAATSLANYRSLPMTEHRSSALG